LGQVVHFDVPFERDTHAWVRGVNAFLPETIAVRWARVVEPVFHARFDAYQRTYHYLIYNHAVRSPIWAGRAGWYHHALDGRKCTQRRRCWLVSMIFPRFARQMSGQIAGENLASDQRSALR